MGDYKGDKKLNNPVPDAKAMKGFLEERNVEVFFAHDCGIKQLKDTFRVFGASLRPGDAAFLYFAGYATRFKNILRLLAISDSMKHDLETEALNLDFLLARLTT